MILIYGKGKVGQAIARLAAYNHISYDICDDTDAPGSYDGYDYIIPSPGIPGTHPIYATGKIVCELDFAYQYLPKGFHTISITGTDGKSTTSWIMYTILKKEFSVNKGVYLSGNFDVPFSQTILDILIRREYSGYIVLEVSSFMSYWIGRNSAFHPFLSDYCIFTNLKSDHLNWHKTLTEYCEAKINLLSHTKKKTILNQQVIDFTYQNVLGVKFPENIRVFQSGGRDSTDGDNIIISGRKKYRLSETHFSGFHNAMNILSVGIIANEMKICSKRVQQYLSDIYGLPHRLEKIGQRNGIVFVEDSKSTSSQSLEAALGSYGNTRNLLLIVGGSDKGDSFLYLAPKFQARVKAMVCIGATKEYFIGIAKQENISYLSTDSLVEGVKFLYPQGTHGDVLMLSPGCASFGLFKDYLDRANQFREIIQKIPD